MHDHYFSINPIRLFMWVVGRSLWRSLVFALSFGLFANRAQISLGGYCIVRGGERGEASASPTPPMPGRRGEAEGLNLAFPEGKLQRPGARQFPFMGRGGSRVPVYMRACLM